MDREGRHERPLSPTALRRVRASRRRSIAIVVGTIVASTPGMIGGWVAISGGNWLPWFIASMALYVPEIAIAAYAAQQWRRQQRTRITPEERFARWQAKQPGNRRNATQQPSPPPEQPAYK